MKKILIIILISLLITLGILWWGRGWFGTIAVDGTPIPISQTFFPRAGNTVSNFIDSVVNQTDTGDLFSNTNNQPDQALSVITKEPIAFADWINTGTSSNIVYIERATGHIYRLNPLTGEVTRLSAATLAPAITATWAQNTNHTYFYIQTSQETNNGWYRVVINNKDLFATSTEPTTNSIKLANNINSITPAPDHKTIFSLEQNGTKVAGYVSKPDGTSRALVWTSNYPDWRVWWGSVDNLYLATKADSSMPSVVYSLNLKTKTLERLVGNSTGISLSPELNGERFIYNTARFGSISTYLFNLVTKQVVVLASITLPEKCFWPKGDTIWCFIPQIIPTNNYPESWYQGLITFSDNLQAINITSGNSDILINPTSLNLTIDGISPFLDQSKKYLYFINKSDAKLWRANLQTVF
ncbi:MAG: hypothetical protein HYV76_02940 [Candidatus Vogelbacteria bacterium]|nr:hypothetical protein [Candidatus Vogelbacteria bacterium]